MKIGYFGDGPWAHQAFKKIVSGRSMTISFVVLRYDTQDELLRKLAEEQNIPVFAHPNVNTDEFIHQIKPFNVDLFVSMSFNQIFRKHFINIPPMKTINCHAGKLPFYRGRNILNWALINDEKEFGITVHYVDEGIDTGDILLQKTYPIDDSDTYATLLDTAYQGCADVLYEAICGLNDGSLKQVKQSSIDPCGTYFGRRQAGDELLDWNQTSREIFNFVRAITIPGPMATAYYKGHEVKIETVEMIKGAHQYKNTVGQIVGKEAGSLIVKTADTTLRVVKYHCDMPIRIGERFESRA